jgi:hypothetical protein
MTAIVRRVTPGYLTEMFSSCNRMFGFGKAGTSWRYAGFGAAAAAFFWHWLTETKCRSLEETGQQVS